MKKRFLTLLLALALLCSLALPAAALQTQPVEVGSALELAQAMAAPASPHRGLFRARTAAAEPTRVIAFTKALADTCGAERVLHLAAWQEYVLEFSDAQTAQHALAQLRTDSNVTDCFLDETFSAEETLSGLWDETPSYSWGGRTMGFTTLRHQAQLLLPAGSSVTVAVIDTGADCTHAMLQGRVSAASYDFANATADVTDINGHGTATAGLVADLTPDAVDVMVLRVYDDNNMSKASRVLTALEYALENGAAVVNLSLGWTNAIEKGYSFLNSVLAQAYASGVVVVAAPGGGTSVRSGTSFAAPHIAAAAACVRLAQPGLSAAGVRQMLYRYADDLGDPGRDDAYGYGLPVLTRYFHDRLCPGQRFRDMPASDIWSHEGLDYCIAAGLISGTSEVTVSPDMLATRAQIVQLLWAAAGSPETAGTLPFTDVSTDAWFYPAVRWAYRTGLVSGTSETTFDPEAPITRQDFALILYTQSGSPAMTGSVLRDFPDVEQVSGYAYAALTWAVEQGLINGVGTPEGALLAPHGYASRAQIATILMAYCDR